MGGQVMGLIEGLSVQARWRASVKPQYKARLTSLPFLTVQHLWRSCGIAMEGGSAKQMSRSVMQSAYTLAMDHLHPLCISSRTYPFQLFFHKRHTQSNYLSPFTCSTAATSAADAFSVSFPQLVPGTWYSFLTFSVSFPQLVPGTW